MLTKLYSVYARFLNDEDGASMVEYGVALLVVAAIGVTAMTLLGGAVLANVQTACAAFGIVC
jgi:Flp pilus assembly pilin Flp